jgi:uncharacterized protein (DUF433 family)
MVKKIVADADTLGGKPHLDGTRITVEFLLELLASGATREAILEAYPQVTVEGLDSALQYSARSLRNESVWDLKLPA